MLIYTKQELRNLPTIYTAQCCDCKVETEQYRVWVCRVAGGVTVEKLKDGRWETIAGDCSNSLDNSTEILIDG